MNFPFSSLNSVCWNLEVFAHLEFCTAPAFKHKAIIMTNKYALNYSHVFSDNNFFKYQGYRNVQRWVSVIDYTPPPVQLFCHQYPPIPIAVLLVKGYHAHLLIIFQLPVLVQCDHFRLSLSWQTLLYANC